MIIYPNDFFDELYDIIGSDDLEKFKKMVDLPSYRGIRINTLKANIEQVRRLLNINFEKTKFCKDGYYIPEDAELSGSDALHLAGAFYMQEPSAMSAVSLLAPDPGDKVLDLCAAPGGKSTQIGCELKGKGLLWSNEIVKSRANILLSNIERMGIKNAIVSNCHPQVLCEKLSGFFDKVLVDAPCSGEGMFRKNPDAISEWSREHVQACALRQLHILNTAKNTLRAGGEMVYSTCTFSYEENEGVIKQFLAENPDFELAEVDMTNKRSYMQGCERIFPMDGGEGHFCAKLIKKGGENDNIIKEYSPAKLSKSDLKTIDTAYGEIFPKRHFGEKISVVNDHVFMIPDHVPDISKLGVMRCGVYLGDIKGNRFEPSHGAFMASTSDQCANYVSLEYGSEDLKKYLHGEEIELKSQEDIKGYTAVTVDGITIGFGKSSNGRLKNKYPKGLRLLNG